MQRAVEAIAKASPERMPTPRGGGGFLGFGGVQGEAGTRAALASMTTSGWLFATVNRIAVAVSSLKWTAYSVNRNDITDRTALPLLHPASMIWNRPNPVDTRMGFNEIYQQHLELAGDCFWLLVGSGIQPTEMWPLRPDRLRPIPSRQNYLDGWLYSINGQEIPIPFENIIHLKMPAPLQEFTGLGPVSSIMTDIGTERLASSWTSSFFENSAEPGGLIQMREGAAAMDDAQFDTFVTRWQQQHRGAANAHRVAVLEGGMEWVDRKITQRDMQLDQLRRWNRDVIFGAFGIQPFIMGVVEDVNRANALAAEDHFARWIVKPRAVRIRETLNMWLAPLFGDNIMYDFEDPIPNNRDVSIKEAEVGAATGTLKVNEIRARLGADALEDGEGGDELASPASTAPATPVTDGIKNALNRAADDAGIRPETVDDAEDAMRRSWEERLEREADALATYIEPFFKARLRIAPVRTTTKIEVSDIDGYDWNWSARYLDDVVEELENAFEVAMLAAIPSAGEARVQFLAAEWARLRGAELLSPAGAVSLVAGTRERVRDLTASAIERGSSLKELQANLRADFEFSRARATRVARTETATALGQGQKSAALEQGRDEKQWVTQGDALVSPDICAPNADQGWIKVGDAFKSGHDTIPGHVNCRCTTIYRTRSEVSDAPVIMAEGFCDAGHLLGMGITAGIHYCWRCKKNVHARDAKTG